MENLIIDDVVKYLQLNGLLHDDQHGFHQNRSCRTQLHETMELWSDRGLAWDTIYLVIF